MPDLQTIHSRKDEYRSHIQGQLWGVIRESALEKTNGLCAFCGAIAKQVHHVRYPKKFTDDGPHNTLPVCERCHEVAHGGLRMNLVKVEQWEKEISPLGIRLEYAIIDNTPYASGDAWMQSMAYPVKDKFAIFLQTACGRLEGAKKTVRVRANDGVILYRWSAIREALRSTDREFHTGKLKQLDLVKGARVNVWALWMHNYDELLWWIDGLVDKAILASTRANKRGQELTTAEHIAAAMAQLNTKVGEHDEILVQHTSEIGELKRTHKNISTHLTARMFCISELQVEPESLPLLETGNRQNLEALLGSELKRRGSVSYGTKSTRLSGNGMLCDVHVWDVKELQLAYDAILYRARRG